VTQAEQKTGRNNVSRVAAYVLVVWCAISANAAYAELRKIKPADTMPEFTLSDSAGGNFVYKHKSGRALAVVLLSANRASQQAADDLQKVLSGLGEDSRLLDVVVVTDEPNALNYFASMPKESRQNLHLLIDKEYKLWGMLGAIVTPTVVIAGKDDTVRWIRAGYGYDFAPAVRSHLSGALEIKGAQPPKDVIAVQTLEKDSPQAKAQRHLKIADMLETRGQIDSALAEARKAKELDPNSVEASLCIGKLCCTNGDGKAALDAVDKIKVQTRPQEAQMNLILGWAHRLGGDSESALKFLLNAANLDPASSRTFYELGKVYHDKHDIDKAQKAYRKALEIVFAGQ
jgi:tetratricopeptide (TPR) repeat protein